MNRQQRRAAAKSNTSGALQPAAALQLGIASHQIGRLAEAEGYYRQALGGQRQQPDALHLIGVVFMQTGRLAQGVELIRRAIALNGTNAEYFGNFGTGLSRLGDLDGAADAYRRAIALNPGFAAAFHDYGNVLLGQGKPDEALTCYTRAIGIDPFYASAHHQRAKVLQTFERHAEALAAFNEALAIKPDNVEALCRRSTVLFALKRFDEALASVEQAKKVDPTYVEAFNICGSTLHRLDRFDEALASFAHALSLDSERPEVLLNRSATFDELHRFEEAALDLDAALTINPQYAEAHWNEGLHRLLLGDYALGWQKNEWRWKCPALKLRDPGYSEPLWLGEEPIAGKTILLHSDQGLGDAIHFSRYATMVAAKGARVILYVEPLLKDVLKDIEGVAQCLGKDEPLPAFDMHCPLSSLPLAFRTTADNIPSDVPYLRPELDHERWRERLAGTHTPRVGLVWSGNPNHANDHRRSIAFAQLAPLLGLPMTFVSLQKDIRPVDRLAMAQHPQVLDLGSEVENFTDTAALLSCLDVVVSVDTSVVHLAGALGCPVWVLLPYTPDWRWLLDRQDSPWYPSARLFRQDAARDWSAVIDNVRVALQRIPSFPKPSFQAKTEECQSTSNLILSH